MKSKIFFMVIFSFIASLATYPYGYRFIYLLHWPENISDMLIGYWFAISAGLANMILGFYSLFVIQIQHHKHIYFVFILSLLGAIPTGFFSYFGYHKIIPTHLNIMVSIIVLLVNVGINFTAMTNLIKSIKEIADNRKSFQKINKIKIIICSIGGILGLIISLTAYLATCNGIAQIVLSYHISTVNALYIGSTLAIFAWIPLGALYLNSTSIVTAKIYDYIVHSRFNLKKIYYGDVLMIFFVLFSGTAFARMVYDFYNPEHIIPTFFKLHVIQSIAYTSLIPLALLSSAAVNYFALIAVSSSIKKKSHK